MENITVITGDVPFLKMISPQPIFNNFVPIDINKLWLDMLSVIEEINQDKGDVSKVNSASE